jgi:hypothetical protein
MSMKTVHLKTIIGNRQKMPRLLASLFFLLLPALLWAGDGDGNDNFMVKAAEQAVELRAHNAAMLAAGRPEDCLYVWTFAPGQRLERDATGRPRFVGGSIGEEAIERANRRLLALNARAREWGEEETVVLAFEGFELALQSGVVEELGDESRPLLEQLREGLDAATGLDSIAQAQRLLETKGGPLLVQLVGRYFSEQPRYVLMCHGIKVVSRKAKGLASAFAAKGFTSGEIGCLKESFQPQPPGAANERSGAAEQDMDNLSSVVERCAGIGDPFYFTLSAPIEVPEDNQTARNANDEEPGLLGIDPSGRIIKSVGPPASIPNTRAYYCISRENPYLIMGLSLEYSDDPSRKDYYRATFDAKGYFQGYKKGGTDFLGTITYEEPTTPPMASKVRVYHTINEGAWMNCRFWETQMDWVSQSQPMTLSVLKEAIKTKLGDNPDWKQNYYLGARDNPECTNVDAGKCPGFTYHSEILSGDQGPLNDAVKNAITEIDASKGTMATPAGNFHHIRFTGGAVSPVSKSELQLLEDRLHLLSHYRGDVYHIVVFMKVENNKLYDPSHLKKMAETAVTNAVGVNSTKKVLLNIVCTSDWESILWTSMDKACGTMGHWQNAPLSQASGTISNINIFYNIMYFYKWIDKPTYISTYYLTAKDMIVYYRKKTLKPSEPSEHLNDIHFLDIRESDYRVKIREKWNYIYSTCYQITINEDGSTIAFNQRCYDEAIKEIETLYKEADSKENIKDPAQWVGPVLNDIKPLRNVLILDKAKTTPYVLLRLKETGAFGANFSIMMGFDEIKEGDLYGFDKMEVLDPIIYNGLDIVGLVPVVGEPADLFGLSYATYRGDVGQMGSYAASTALPLVGNAAVKAGAVMLGSLYVVVAKKTGDEVELIKKGADAVLGEKEKIVTAPHSSENTDKLLDKLNTSSDAKDNIARSFDEIVDLFDFLPGHWPQATKDAFKLDYGSAPDAFRALFDNAASAAQRTKLAEAWGIVKKARGSNSVFKTDAALLQKVTDLGQNATFMQRIGGGAGLEEIIKANVRARCKSCGDAGAAFLKHIDEYLDDVKHFVDNYHGIDGFESVLQDLKRLNSTESPNYNMEGAAFMLRVMKAQEGNFLGKVSKFEGSIDDLTNGCRYDLTFTNGGKTVFGEFKSYGETSLSSFLSANSSTLQQFRTYLGTISSLDELRYFFDIEKIADIGTIKNRFKTVFENNAEDWFKSVDEGGLGELKIKQLFGNDIDSIDDFVDIVGNINSPIYNFIKTY